jgi:tetrahydromethanopterin S-methyltransferase subunit G
MEDMCEFDDSAILRKLDEVLRKLQTLERRLDEVAGEVHQIKSRQ